MLTTCCYNIKMLLGSRLNDTIPAAKEITSLRHQVTMNTWQSWTNCFHSWYFVNHRVCFFLYYYYAVLFLVCIVSVSNQEIGRDRKVCLSGCRSFYRWREWIRRLTQTPRDPFFRGVDWRKSWLADLYSNSRQVRVFVCVGNRVKLNSEASQLPWGLRNQTKEGDRYPGDCNKVLVPAHTHKLIAQSQTSWHPYRDTHTHTCASVCTGPFRGATEQTCCVWTCAFSWRDHCSRNPPFQGHCAVTALTHTDTQKIPTRAIS